MDRNTIYANWRAVDPYGAIYQAEGFVYEEEIGREMQARLSPANYAEYCLRIAQGAYTAPVDPAVVALVEQQIAGGK